VVNRDGVHEKSRWGKPSSSSSVAAVMTSILAVGADKSRCATRNWAPLSERWGHLTKPVDN
jgi:hypothetical protein